MFLKSFGAVLAAIALAAACGQPGRDKVVLVEGDAFLGPADAKVTVVEYGSPTCPGCKFWHDKFFEELKSDYVETGKVKFIFREFAIHGAVDAGIFSVARCSGTGDYFAVLDEAFANQNEIVDRVSRGDAMGPLYDLGAKFRLSQAQVKSCVDNPENVRRVNDVGAYVRRIGVNSTPTFFVNGVEMTNPDLQSVWRDTRAAIDAALAGPPATEQPADDDMVEPAPEPAPVTEQ